ncbi:Tetraspanin/Peripherin, partial [Phascolomyces articulosus]
IVVNILGLIICFTAVIGLIGAFCQERQAIHILYTTIVVIALIYQISVAVIVYDQAAHTTQWLSQTWSEATQEYRTFAENKFSCCGFSHAYDHPVPTATCHPDDIVNSAQPCYHPLTRFMQHNLQIIYIVLFAALSIEVLALCNAVTLLC